MKVITDIKIVEVDIEQFYKDVRSYSAPIHVRDGEYPHQTIEITREIIEGKRYRLPYGEEVTIGVSDDVFKLLDIPLKAIEKERELSESFMERNEHLQKELQKYKNMKFLDRLKYIIS